MVGNRLNLISTVLKTRARHFPIDFRHGLATRNLKSTSRNCVQADYGWSPTSTAVYRSFQHHGPYRCKLGVEVRNPKRLGPAYPFKNMCVADSSECGETWSPMRHVTTQFGQCHAAGVGLQKGRVVVVHDHRYPQSMSSARTVVSNDEGQTWRDELYYLSHGNVAGYARTIRLDGQEMLTLTGSHYGEAGNWHDATGNTQFHIVRWQLVD